MIGLYITALLIPLTPHTVTPKEVIEVKATTTTEYKLTGYYKPLQGQSRYATGSYDGDIRLNGGGLTASGKVPKEGMLACPSTFKFGDVVEFENGKHVCEDRGGSIKGMRLDIFTGEGEEGLNKALKTNRMINIKL